MAKFKLSQRSIKRMEGIHEDLYEVVCVAIGITTIDFGVTEGLRTVEKQREYVKKGVSRTMKSRHITGHAVDLAAYVGARVSWEMPLYVEIAKAVKYAADEISVPIQWGGDWKKFKDGPHFQLTWKAYPA